MNCVSCGLIHESWNPVSQTYMFYCWACVNKQRKAIGMSPVPPRIEETILVNYNVVTGIRTYKRKIYKDDRMIES